MDKISLFHEREWKEIHGTETKFVERNVRSNQIKSNPTIFSGTRHLNQLHQYINHQLPKVSINLDLKGTLSQFQA